jgi:DNA-binding NtrC family response regulator
MQIIASDTNVALAGMLEGYDAPAILVTADYRILATNERYRERFGEIAADRPAHCYAISHGYDRPCDQAGEDCPLATAQETRTRSRVLHIHQTPGGQEHVDVEMLPILDEGGELSYFVELLKPVPTASAQVSSEHMVGRSRAFNALVEQISRVGPSDASVLLLGESGTGKEMVARAVHDSSARADKPMVTLECAGLTESLFESELFGHVKGAFTGANYNRQGLADAADGGTLFLDEVGDIPLPLQVKLLRLIETGMYRPVGSVKPRRSDFRLVCATHKNLWHMVEAGEFRQDLYFRINVFPLHVPSLAEREEDIALLAASLLQKLRPGEAFELTGAAIEVLKKHEFRGNIRELRNILSRAVVLSDTGVIDGAIIARSLGIAATQDAVTPVDLKTLERDYLRGLMEKYQGDRARVARVAGISVRTLYRKLSAVSP